MCQLSADQTDLTSRRPNSATIGKMVRARALTTLKVDVDFAIADRGLQPTEVADGEHLSGVGVMRIPKNRPDDSRDVQKTNATRVAVIRIDWSGGVDLGWLAERARTLHRELLGRGSPRAELPMPADQTRIAQEQLPPAQSAGLGPPHSDWPPRTGLASPMRRYMRGT
jgi:hypothetical protein